MIDVLVVFGTRPELLKLAPLLDALLRRGMQIGVVNTGQHTSLLDAATLARFEHVASLGIASDGSVLKFTVRAQRVLEEFIRRVEPRCVVVQGDTMSAHAGAMAAAACDVPVAHVEAGLRSGDLNDPWPEEGIRRAITRIATWHYAPTAGAAKNAMLEAPVRNREVLVVGNTSIDALRLSGVTPKLEASPMVLVTLHRRELRLRTDVGDVIRALIAAAEAAPHVKVVWPIHPAMQEGANYTVPPNFVVCPPLAHAAMLSALAEARGVLTDSGGVVEEAAALGVPTAVLRNVTDRPEAEEAGIAVRFPPTPAGVTLAWNMLATCAVPRVPVDVFGDGHAAEYIARHLAKVLK